MVHSSEACLAYRLVQTERTCYSSSVGSLRPCNLPPRGTSVIRSRTDCSPYNALLLELAPHCAPLIYASIRARFGLPTYPPPPPCRDSCVLFSLGTKENYSVLSVSFEHRFEKENHPDERCSIPLEMQLARLTRERATARINACFQKP